MSTEANNLTDNAVVDASAGQAPGAAALKMPPRGELVAEATARFDTAGRRSQLLALDQRTLQDLGMWLSDREANAFKAFHWLNNELGGTDEDPRINKNAVYRFAVHFRELFDQVRAEHARRIARLSVSQVTDGAVQQMSHVAQMRLMEILTEKLVETNSMDELSVGQVMSAVAALDAHSKGVLKAEELRLKQAESERKAQKLSSDLATAELEREELKRKLDAASKALSKAKEAVDPVMHGDGSPGGGTMTREQVYEILDRVMRGEAA